MISSVKNGTFWNLLGSILPMLVGMACIPFLLEKLGVEKFGVLTLIWTLIGYFNIFDFGIGRALTYSVSNFKAQPASHRIYQEIKIGLKFLLAAGIIGGLLLSIVSRQLSFKWLNINYSYQEEVYYALLVSAVGIPFTTYTSGLKGILEGFEEFKVVNILKLIHGILNFLLPVLSIVLFGNSLFILVLTLLINRVFVLLLHQILVFKKISFKRILLAEIKTGFRENSLFKFGAWMTLSNIVSPLMVNADRFFISFFLGASLVAFYTVPFDLVIRVLLIPASFTSVLFPRFSFLLSKRSNEAFMLYKKSIKTVFILMLLIMLFIICFSYLGLKYWISEVMADNCYKILIILSVGVFFNSLAQVPHSLIQASGNVKFTAMLHVFEFLIYIFLLPVMLKKVGLIGVAIAFTCRTLIDFLALTRIAEKILSESLITRHEFK